MRDPFAAALDAQFRAPGSAAAVYISADGTVLPIRVIRSQPDAQVSFGSGKLVREEDTFDIRRAEIAAPHIGDRLMLGAAIVNGQAVGGEPFELRGQPMIDVEGLTWSCGAVPAP